MNTEQSNAAMKHAFKLCSRNLPDPSEVLGAQSNNSDVLGSDVECLLEGY
jgi:hypothetical protein